MKKIIIVDDDPGIQDAFRLIFSGEDYDVTIFTDGFSFLKNKFQHPDIFIIDKQLSGVDGLDLCLMLKSREDTRHIPVIMLSASPQIQRLAKAAGADESIEKPFRIRNLRETVERHLFH